MKKTISLVTVCSMLFATNFIYADNEDKSIGDKLEENRQEQTTLEGKIKDLDSKVQEIEKDIEETNSKLETLDIEIETTQDEIKTLENDIKENEEALGERLKAINSNYSIGYMKVILSSTSLSDFFNNIFIVKQVVEQDKEMLKELDEDKIEIEKKQNNLNDKKNEQENLKAMLEENNIEVKNDKEELEFLKSELESEEDKLQSELELIASQAQGSDIDDSLSGEIISSGSWPVPGYSRVSSPYGYRTHPVLNTQKMHTGIDIPAPSGTPVVSVDSGKVIYSGVQGSYGNTVMVQHNDGKVSLYAHNSQLLVSVGQTVEKGQAIAKVGSTGRSTGPHLHFEIRINGKHTNPLPYIG